MGDIIAAGDEAQKASSATVMCVWVKFRELLPIWNYRGASFQANGKIYKAFVQWVPMYGSGTRPARTEDVQRLERTEHAIAYGSYIHYKF